MKVIVIRGLPGVGKSLVSKILKEIFLGCEIICVDKFKVKAMKDGKNFDESKKFAYEQALKKLDSLYKKDKNYVILDEMICNKDFYNQLNNFIKITKSYAYWFRVMRPIEKLLEIESNRKRKIKNNLKDFIKLRKDVEACRIKDEYCIKNDNLALTIKKILEIVI